LKFEHLGLEELKKTKGDSDDDDIDHDDSSCNDNYIARDDDAPYDI
jgi:hypothetical protein